MGKRGQLTKYPVRLPLRVSEAMSDDLDFIAAVSGQSRAKTMRHVLAVGARAVKQELVRSTRHGTPTS